MGLLTRSTKILREFYLNAKGYKIKDLYGTDLDLFQKETKRWVICSEDQVIKTRIDSKFTLFASDPPQASANTFYFVTAYILLAQHKSALGSAKIWFSDGFPNGSSLVVEVFMTDANFENTEELKKPCKTMNISFPQKSNFKNVYFGDNVMINGDLIFLVKMSIHSNHNYPVDSISFGLREVTIYLSNDFWNETNFPVPPLFGQDCAVRQIAMFAMVQNLPSVCFALQEAIGKVMSAVLAI